MDSVSAMEIVRRVVVFDASDVSAESAFWAAVLDGEVVGDDEEFHCVLDRAGRWCVGVQLAPHHLPPVWPHGEPPQQVHFDLHIAEPLEAHEKVIRLGARLLQAAPDLNAEEGHQVYADPAGHPFCLGWGQPSPEKLAAFVIKRFGHTPASRELL